MIGAIVLATMGLICGVDAYTHKLSANEPVTGVFFERRERPGKETEKKKKNKMLNVTYRANPRAKLRS